MKLGLTSGELESQNFSVAPQATVALAFNKKAINSFFNGFLTKEQDDLFVFSKGDSSFIEFSHEYGQGSNSSDSLSFKLKIVDENNIFLNALFGQRASDYLNRAKELVPSLRQEAAEEAATLTDSFLQNNPDYFDLQVLSKLDESLTAKNNFYISYGIGPSNKYWAGPFLCTLSKGLYKENADGLTMLQLEFVGSKSTEDLKIKRTTDPNTTTNQFKDSIPFMDITTTQADVNYLAVDRTKTFFEANFVFKSTQVAIEALILQYLRSLGIENVLLCFRDIPKAFSDYVRDVPELQVETESSKISSTNFPQDIAFFTTDAEQTDPPIMLQTLKNYFYVLGLSFDSQVIVEDELGPDDKTRIFTLSEDVSNLTKVSSSQFSINQRNGVSLETLRWAGLEWADSLLSFNDTSRRVVNTWALSLDTSKVLQDNKPIQPVINLLNSLQGASGKLIDATYKYENNSETVQKLHEIYPEFVPNPDESILIIGENALIQRVLYGKDSSIDYRDLMSPSVNSKATTSVVDTVASRAAEIKKFFDEVKVKRPYTSIYDINAPIVPDDFALAQETVDKILKYNIPTFRVNTKNPNVTKMSVTSDGYLISTISQTCSQLAHFIASTVSDQTPEATPLLRNESELQSTIEEVLSTYHGDNMLNNVEDVIDVGSPNFAEIASEVTKLILAKDAKSYSRFGTRNTKVGLMSYLYNFYKLFSLSHKAIVRTVPHFNFSDSGLLGDNCILFKNVNKSLLNDNSVTNSIYTGVWTVLGFKHYIGSDDAYSEFSLIKKPFSLEKEQ